MVTFLWRVRSHCDCVAAISEKNKEQQVMLLPLVLVVLVLGSAAGVPTGTLIGPALQVQGNSLFNLFAASVDISNGSVGKPVK